MNSVLNKPDYWKYLFWLLPMGYCLYYAPYGINETDGGFLTGLAWQLICGKTLYADVLYVRPPLPVWLRALELLVLPENWAILGERWIFYWKLALYSWLGAAVLLESPRRWMLAVFGFVLAAHCYPAAAWHTVDGILFGALCIWCWTNCSGKKGAVFSGIFLVAMLLCKQSFYPMVLVWAILVYFWAGDKRRAIYAGAAALATLACFGGYLWSAGLLESFLEYTSGAGSVEQAFDHGLLDYFRIQPALLALCIVLLAPAVWWSHVKQNPRLVFGAWVLLLLALTASYAWTIGQRQDFTAPFAQTRLLFGLAVLYATAMTWKKYWYRQQILPFGALLALSWSASVSWGYNLPVLFALPWAYVLLDISQKTFVEAFPGRRTGYLPALALLGLLALFRWAYEFVYRDGPRSQMTIPMGTVLPRLRGIYSNPETAELYRDLDRLHQRYGPDTKTLPAFPHANFLTNSQPPLPLDWVVKREMGLGALLVEKTVQETRPHLLIEKSYLNQIQTDPELGLVKSLLLSNKVVGESSYFLVIQL